MAWCATGRAPDFPPSHAATVERLSEEDAIQKLHAILGPALVNGGFSRVPAILETLVQYIRAEYAGEVPEEGHVFRAPVDDEEDDGEEDDDEDWSPSR